MSRKENFLKFINNRYTSKSETITLVAAPPGEETITNTFVKIPPKTLNRNGLIAGATVAGKTKKLQIFVENLSEKGIPVLLSYVKDDLSGLAKASPRQPKIDERHKKTGIPFTAKLLPQESLTISEQNSTRLRAPMSRMDILTASEIEKQIKSSKIGFKYN